MKLINKWYIILKYEKILNANNTPNGSRSEKFFEIVFANVINKKLKSNSGNLIFIPLI
jgi:hypothetical protein